MPFKQLAILGACQCRKDNPDPCGCSYAAANLKREVALLMVESARYERQLAQLQLRIAMDNQEQPGQDDGLADRIGSGDEGQGGGKPGGILCSIHLRTVFVSGRQILK